MVEQLQANPGADAVNVTIGDMTTTRVPGAFQLVYLVANTIMNVTTQEEQIAVFANAAAHLGRDGYFAVEVIVPQLRRVPPGDVARVFTLDANHVGIELDLMARLARLHRRHRWAGWGKEPFTSESTSQVAVYRRNRDSAP